MENNKNMTVKEVLVIVMNRLNDISVPMKLKRQIADPIEHSVHDLQACVEAITAAEKAMEQKEPENEEEPVLEIVPEEETSDE